MWKGELEAIYISPKKGDEMQSLQQVRAVPGKGLVGDRYFQRAEVRPNDHSPENEVTLIEVETYDALQRDYNLSLDPGTSRRNLVTRGLHSITSLAVNLRLARSSCSVSNCASRAHTWRN